MSIGWSRSLSLAAALALAGPALVATPAAALPTTLSFTVVLDASGGKPPGVSTGDTLTGTLVWDLDEILQEVASPSIRSYAFNPGTATFSFDVNGVFSRSGQLGIQVVDGSYDILTFSGPTAAPVNQWYIEMRDSSTVAWNTTHLDQIPLSTITDPNIFSGGPFDFRQFGFWDDVGQVYGELTALSVVQTIPAPAALGLFGLGLAGLGLAARRCRPG